MKRPFPGLPVGRLLYVGIAARHMTTRSSTQNLHKRVRHHFRSNAYSSTLRLSLVARGWLAESAPGRLTLARGVSGPGGGHEPDHRPVDVPEDPLGLEREPAVAEQAVGDLSEPLGRHRAAADACPEAAQCRAPESSHARWPGQRTEPAEVGRSATALDAWACVCSMSSAHPPTRTAQASVAARPACVCASVSGACDRAAPDRTTVAAQGDRAPGARACRQCATNPWSGSWLGRR